MNGKVTHFTVKAAISFGKRPIQSVNYPIFAQIFEQMRGIYFILILLSATTISCSNSANSEKSTSTAAMPAAKPASKLSDAGTQKLTSLVADYYGLKDAFVATNVARVDSAASKMLSSADALTAYLKEDSANGATLKPYLDTISSETKNLLATKDETCEKKRIPFSKISDQLCTMLKKADVKNAGIYQQHCPMAFDDKGGNWLSNESEIKNPYFGKKMLECGDVTDSLK